MLAPMKEADLLRGFVLTVLEHLRTAASDWALEPVRTTTSLSGLREAARDAIGFCEEMKFDEVRALDLILARRGLPTLSEMRDRRYQELLRILSRGRIVSADEARLVNSLVSDVDSTVVSRQSRVAAEQLLAHYERP